MKRSFIWLFAILIPVIALILIGAAQTCTPPAAIPSSVTVSDAGSTDVNGTYNKGDDVADKPSWSYTGSSDTYSILWCIFCNRWEIQGLSMGELYWDTTSSTDNVPPKTGWSGINTPPTLSF